MMNYENFKEVVKESFMDYMPEKYKKATLKIREINKVNCVLDGITLTGVIKGISPTIYINDMYNHYMNCGNIDKVLRVAAKTMEEGFINTPNDIDSLTNFNDAVTESIKKNIVFQFVNTEQNKELLKVAPHREFQDLSIVYRWVVRIEKKSIQSTIITNELANKFNLTEQQLYNLAYVNTANIFPPVVKSMNDVIYDLFMDNGISAEEIKAAGALPLEQEMWVITNDRGINGAASILYTDVLSNLADKLDSDLYILPSSVHEVITVSSKSSVSKDVDDLAQMVHEINMTQVELDERLSNQVYFYDRTTQQISLATNTEFKRLDNKQN